MLLRFLSHLIICSTLLILAFSHPLADQNEQHNSMGTMKLRGLSQTISDYGRLNHRAPTFSRRQLIIESYRLSLSHQVQILPITIAAQKLRAFWTDVMIAANSKWQSNDHILLLQFGQLLILSESDDDNIPLN